MNELQMFDFHSTNSGKNPPAKAAATSDAISPFDAIKQADEQGAEFWSARDLMGLMGYARWEDFAKVTQRAWASARNSGTAQGFSEITEKLSTGGRPRQDYNLSRFAAYLVAMNGDPNMEQVAAAQAYFAVQTRKAEVLEASTSMSEEQIVAQALQITSRKVQELTARNQALEPKAQAYEDLMDSDGLYSVATVAKILGIKERTLFRFLRDSGVFIASAGDKYNTPYAKYMGHFSLRASVFDHPVHGRTSSYSTKVRPTGLDFIRKRAHAAGLLHDDAAA